MIKTFCLLLLGVCLLSCNSLQPPSSVSFCGIKVEESSSLHTGEIRVFPESTFGGITSELKNIVRACLKSGGISVAEDVSEADFLIDMIIHRSRRMHDLRNSESVTISLKLKKAETVRAYLISSEESEYGTSSLSWTIDFIKRHISAFTAMIYERP